MKPIFPKWTNSLKPIIAMGALSKVIIIVLIISVYATDAHLSVGYKPDQPIDFSHRLHAGEMGIDCRYCHTNVDKSPHATVPPAQVCMNCHSQVKKDSPKLKPLYDRYKKMVEKDLNGVKIKVENKDYKKSIPWVRIHNLPDYSYFDHSAHINANVGCISCHDRIDQMPVVKQTKSLSMGWCLDCHRNYEDHVRPDHVAPTDMKWSWETEKNVNMVEFKKELKESKKLNPPEECSACHR